MIAWTSSFPWKCKLSCSPPEGTGRVMVLWNGTSTWSAIPGCKGFGRFAEESVYCSLQMGMQYSLHPVLRKPNALQTKSTSTEPMQNLEHYDVFLLSFWALFQHFSKKSCCFHRGICQSKAQKLHFNFILILICTNSVNECEIHDWRPLGQQLPDNQKKDKTLHNSTNQL